VTIKCFRSRPIDDGERTDRDAAPTAGADGRSGSECRRPIRRRMSTAVPKNDADGCSDGCTAQAPTGHDAGGRADYDADRLHDRCHTVD
jgi:hypothetical protein